MPRPSPARTKAADTVNRMLAADVRGCTIRELADASGASKSTIRRMLMVMLDAEQLRTYPDPYNKGELRYQRVGNVTPMLRKKGNKR